MNIFEDCSPKELKILEYFAEALEKNPKCLKETLLCCSLVERAKTIAFIKVRVPKLGEEIEKLVYGSEQ